MNITAITSFFMLVITAFASLVQYNVPVTVTINPIYNLSIEVNVISETVLAGDNLITSIKLEKTGQPGEITVDLGYSILKMNKEVVETGDADSVDVTDEVEKNITISIPSSIRPGRYILNITTSHPQAREANDYDYFWVRKTMKESAWEGFVDFIDRLLDVFRR